MAGSVQSSSLVGAAAHAIPEDARSSRASLTMACWSVCSTLFSIFLAATLAVAYGAVNTIIALVRSVITYGLVDLFGDRVLYHSSEVPRFNPAGLATGLVGAGVGLLMTLTGVGAAWAPVVTVVLAAGIYTVLMRHPSASWFSVAEVGHAEPVARS